MDQMLACPAMTRLPTLVAALCAAVAANAADNKGPEPISVAIDLQPKKVHEECTRLDAGHSRRWHWKSDAPVDFNIHYHRGEDVFYPVKRDGMRGDGGTFSPKEGEEYCWMWTAKGTAAKVEGRVEVK